MKVIDDIDNLMLHDLNDDQKGHLAWRLERHTYVGYITSCKIVKDDANATVVSIFQRAEKSLRSARLHARAVRDFKVDPELKRGNELSIEAISMISRWMVRTDITPKQQRMVYDSIKAHINRLEYSWEILYGKDRQNVGNDK